LSFLEARDKNSGEIARQGGKIKEYVSSTKRNNLDFKNASLCALTGTVGSFIITTSTASTQKRIFIYKAAQILLTQKYIKSSFTRSNNHFQATVSILFLKDNFQKESKISIKNLTRHSKNCTMTPKPKS